ncbi:MAG: NUDIX domain-containing protein [Ginsengibacter sp.]
MIFNVRVYGILVNEKKQILLSDEIIRGNFYTKFPGGGLEIGEGTRDCLQREFLEEMNLRVEVGDHLYTTDFYQQSAFNPDHQIISIYYHVSAKETFDLGKINSYNQEQSETFRFLDLHQFSEEDVTLPIDKVVARKLTRMR